MTLDNRELIYVRTDVQWFYELTSREPQIGVSDTTISSRCYSTTTTQLKGVIHVASSLHIKEQDRPLASEYFLVANSYRRLAT